MNISVKTSRWNFDETVCISVTLVVTNIQLLNLVFPKVYCIYSKATTIAGFKAFEVRFYCMDEKFPLKLFHLYIETNKAYFEKKRFWTETSESRLLYKVWTDMTSSALETFPSCFLLSLRMLTLASLECQWSPLKVIYDVICDGLWYLRALQMTVPQEGDATRPASNSYAYMCRETGGELLYPKQTFTRL